MINNQFKTKMGKYYISDIEEFLSTRSGRSLRNKVQLIMTSPPFPLNEKKSYGNLQGEAYKDWFTKLAPIFSQLLTDDGSIVIELGNAWMPKRPIQSLLYLESFLGFLNNPEANLRLCQEFICYNPARLPSPAQWVTVKRIRVIDSYTHIWWMAKNDYPKADNRRILRPYSKSMKSLLKRKSYNSGYRPSGHNIGETSFMKDSGGSIVHNVIELEQISDDRPARLPKNVLSIANTQSNDFFLRTCRERGIRPHPARMPIELAKYFIEFLTDPGDLVFDPFAGSNIVGYCAEVLSRKWIATERNEDYGKQSLIRFEDPSVKVI